MMRHLWGFLLTLASCCAYAQSSGAEAPVEHASMFTVVVFVVLFAAVCLGYVGYAWSSARKRKERDGM